MNCVSRLPWEQHFSALQYRAVEEGEGLGLFARRGHAGVSLYNPINAGTGSNGVHVPTKAPSGHKLSPCKGSWRHLGGEKRQIFNGECLPHHVLEPASAPGNTKKYPAIKSSGCKAERSGTSGGCREGQGFKSYAFELRLYR